jgi:hypothetical protein
MLLTELGQHSLFLDFNVRPPSTYDEAQNETNGVPPFSRAALHIRLPSSIMIDEAFLFSAPFFPLKV